MKGRAAIEFNCSIDCWWIKGIGGSRKGLENQWSLAKKLMLRCCSWNRSRLPGPSLHYTKLPIHKLMKWCNKREQEGDIIRFVRGSMNTLWVVEWCVCAHIVWCTRVHVCFFGGKCPFIFLSFVLTIYLDIYIYIYFLIRVLFGCACNKYTWNFFFLKLFLFWFLFETREKSLSRNAKNWPNYRGLWGLLIIYVWFFFFFFHNECCIWM